MRVWGVRNFYSSLEHLCEEGSEFSFGYFALVVVAALLATGGLLSNSIPVIIGSMCVAPFLGPSRTVCVGIVYRKWRTVGRGLVKQLAGLLVIGSTLAFFVTLAFLRLAPEITVTPTIIARTFPTLQSLYLASFVAITSGVAASLALVATPRIVSEPWEQLLDVMIGAEIAVSLIPPASVIGIGLAFNRPDVAFQSLGLLMINVVCLDIISTMPVLYLWGVGSKPLQLEKKIREIIEKTLKDNVKTDKISAEVTLHSFEKADVHVELHAFETHGHTEQLLAKRISEQIKTETGVSNNVRMIVIPVSMYTS
jgi:uncharacterized hydrophobic protein (TIGR00271 family)